MPARTFFPLFIFLLQIPYQSFCQYNNLYPVKVAGKLGLINDSGRVMLPAEYDEITWRPGKEAALVRRGQQFGWIDSQARQILPAVYDQIVPDFPHLHLTKDGKQGYYHLPSGNMIAAAYDSLQILNRDFLLTGKKEGGQVKVGLAGIHGKVLLPTEYEEILLRQDSTCHVKQEGRWRVFNLKTRQWSPFEFDALMSFGSGLAGIKTEGKWHLYDAEAGFSASGFDSIFIASNGLFYIREKGKTGICDVRGNIIIPAQYEDLYLAENRVHFSQNGSWGIMDLEQKMILRPEWTRITPLDEELYLVQFKESYGVLTREGKQVIPPVWDQIHGDSNGFLTAVRGRNEVLFTRLGERIGTAKFDDIGPFKDGIAVIRKGDDFGVINDEGKVLIPTQYRRIALKEGGVAKLFSDSSATLKTFADGEVSARKKFIIVPGDEGESQSDNSGSQSPGTGSGDYDEGTRRGKYGWFWSDSLRLWGLVKPSTGDTLIQPFFRYIRIFEDLGLTQVTRVLPGGRELVGLVDHLAFKIIAKPVFRSLETQQFENGNCIRGQAANGQWVLIHRTGKTLTNRRISYIGPFREGLARFNYGGKKQVESIRRVAWVEEVRRHGNLSWVNVHGGKWGFIDRDGRIVQPPRFDYVSEFSGEIFYARKDKKWGVLNGDFEEVRPFEYAFISKIDEDLPVLQTHLFHQQFAFMNEYGEMKILPQFERARPFAGGYAAVQQNGKWGFIDRDGNQVIPMDYQKVKDFEEGIALVKQGRNWYYLKPDGKRLHDQGFLIAFPYSEGLSRVKQDGLFGYIDMSGKFVIPPTFTYAEDFSGGVALIRGKKGLGLISPTGEILLEPGYSEIFDFTGDYAVVRDKKNYGVIDRRGNVLVPVRYNFIFSSDAGIFSVRRGRRYGIMDQQGEWLVKPRFDQLQEFREGFAAVRDSGKWGYIHPDGTWLVTPRFHKANAFSDGRAVARDRAGWVILNSDGKKVSQEIFTRITSFQNGLASIRNAAGQWSVIDTSARRLTQNWYEMLRILPDGKFIGSEGEQQTLHDRDGSVLFSLKLNSMPHFSEGMAAFIPGERLGLVNAEGEEVLPPVYESLEENQNLIEVKLEGKSGYLSAEGEWVWELSK